MFSQPGGVQDELLLAVLWIFQFDIFIRKYPIFLSENIQYFLSENILMYPNADHIFPVLVLNLTKIETGKGVNTFPNSGNSGMPTGLSGEAKVFSAWN